MSKDIAKLNQRELELGITGTASWHYDYRHSAYIVVANLEPRLSEGDLLVVFSQFGEIVDQYLCRDKKTGVSKGVCFIAFEDQRSTILAIDNMNESVILGRTLMVDHASRFSRPKYSKREAGEEIADETYEDSDDDVDKRRQLIFDYEAYLSEEVDSEEEEQREQEEYKQKRIEADLSKDDILSKLALRRRQREKESTRGA